MTTVEAMKRLENDWFIALSGQLCVDMDKKDAFLEAIGIAITAIRAQQEREKNEPLMLENVAQAYLEICEHDCVGDDSVGIPCCQFYKWPDLDDDENPCLGECMLNPCRHKPKED